MGSPVAFGDIVAAIQTVNKIVKSLRDHGGARDNYQRLTRRLDHNISLLNRMESLGVEQPSEEYEALLTDIRKHATDMGTKASSLQQRLSSVEGRLGESAPRGWHRALVPKMQFVKNRSLYGQIMQEMEEDGSDLDRMIGLMNMQLNSAAISTAKTSLSILRRQEASTISSGSSLAAQEETIASHVDGSLARASMETRTSPYSSPWKTHGAIQTHAGKTMSRMGASSFNLHNAEAQCLGFGYNTIGSGTNLDMSQPAEARALLHLLVLCLWRDAVSLWTQAGFALLPILLLMQSPAASVSFLLPDNFTLEDAIGRQYSLNPNHFDDWSVLDSLLRSRFGQGVVGSDKVRAGQYRIFDVNDPSRVITALDAEKWRSRLGPRKRFRMSIVLSGVRLTNMRCAKCGSRLRSLQRFTFSCPNGDCGMFLQSLALRKESLKHQWEQLGQAKGFGDWYLQVSSERTHAFFGKLSDDVLERRSSFLSYLQLSQDQTTPYEDRAGKVTSEQLKSDGEPITGATPTDHESTSNRDEADSAEEHDKKDLDASPEDSQSENDDSTADKEAEDLQFYRGICIRPDTSLYDAVLLGDYERAELLIDHGTEVDSNPGPLGTALVPAILSQSDLLVRLLLNTHANPLLDIGEGQSPLSLAAWCATQSVLDEVLFAALRWSSHHPREFQRAIDGALFQAMSNSSMRYHVKSLLIAGANPLSSFGSDGITAFGMVLALDQVFVERTHVDVSLREKRTELISEVLLELWIRDLISDDEAQGLHRAVHGVVDESLLTPRLIPNARNLVMNRADLLAKVITQRLGRGRYFKIQTEKNRGFLASLIKFWSCNRGQGGLEVVNESETELAEVRDILMGEGTGSGVEEPRGPRIMINGVTVH